MIKHSHYVEDAKSTFADTYLRTIEGDTNYYVAVKELDNLLNMARIHGAEQERYRILDKVRNKSAGIVVEAFGGDLKKMLSLGAEKLAEDLERESNG